jgi:hypothetical protein
MSLHMDKPEFGPFPIRGQAQIRPCPCTGTSSLVVASPGKYNLFPVKYFFNYLHCVLGGGQGRIQPYPCTGTCSKSGLSLYMDRAEFGHVHGHDQIWACTWTWPNLGLYMDMDEFRPIPVHRQCQIHPCSCIMTNLNMDEPPIIFKCNTNSHNHPLNS